MWRADSGDGSEVCEVGMRRGAVRSAGTRETKGEAGQQVEAWRPLSSAFPNIPVVAEGSSQGFLRGRETWRGLFFIVGKLGLVVGAGPRLLKGITERGNHTRG